MGRFSLTKSYSYARNWTQTNFQRTLGTLALAWEIDRPALTLVLLLTVLSAILPLGIAFTAKLIIDAVIAKSVHLTVLRVILESGLVVLQAACIRGLGATRTILGMRLVLEINSRIVQKSAALKLWQIESPDIRDMLNRADRESSSRPMQMLVDLFQIIQSALTLIGYIGILFAFTPLAVFVLLAAAMPATIAEMRFSNRRFRHDTYRSLDRRRLFNFEHVLTSELYAKEIRTLSLASLLLGRHRAIGEKLFREDRKLLISRTAWATLLSLLALAAFYGFYLIIARNAALGLLTIGNLTLFVMALRQGQQSFQTALTSIGGMYEHNLYMSNLFDFLAISVPIETTLKIATSPEGIVFDDVSFRYPGQENWTLQNISLSIQTGENVALIGFNGAGKTTLIKLLCRLYDPTEGRILIDGVDLREWKEDELFRRLSVVFQDFNRYNLTFGENIGIGDVPNIENETQIRQALDKGRVQEIYESLPRGLKTQLGRSFDGSELSGGQWQRVALARVFMKISADILILDEPTASLDPQAEYESLQVFRDVTRGKTSIIISHHFPVARIANRIIVLEHGRVIEDGSHEDLLRAQGRYAHLFSLQAQGYSS